MRRTIAFAALGLAMMFATTARADDAACKPVIDALSKMAQTPYHEWAVEYGRDGRLTEKVALTDSMYVFMDGKWRQLSYDQTSAAAEAIGSMRNSSCWVVREESVDGEKATLYGVHSMKPGGSDIDIQVWVSKVRALPIKELLMQPKDGQAHAMNIRFDYLDVTPPI